MKYNIKNPQFLVFITGLIYNSRYYYVIIYLSALQNVCDDTIYALFVYFTYLFVNVVSNLW